MKRYRLEAELGEGTMGKVYRAQDLDLDRPVAVKVLKPSAFADETIRKRFIREAQVTAALSHPNLVTVFDAGQEDNTLYLVMELVEGTSLDKMIEKKEKSVTHFLEILEKVARGVHQAHERGAVHRDLKPANILVSKAGVPKVTDFGLAHLMQADSLITRSGATVGTPVYMAPEQAQGLNQAISPRTDVYALGAILYEICTRRPPHDGQTVVEIYEKIIHRPVIAPRRLNAELHPDVERIILKAISKKPAGRYKTALEFADDVKRHLDGEPVRAAGPAAARTNWIGWAIGAVAILAIAVIAAIVTKKEPTPVETPVAAPPPFKPAVATTTAWADLNQALTPTLRDFEDLWHASKPQAEAEARLKQLEPRIREVEVRHPTSTLPKAWLALAHMYLNRKTWKDELADACRGAGDDPGPWGVAAVCYTAAYARKLQFPQIVYQTGAISITPYQETEELKKNRLDAIAALDHIRKSPSWDRFTTARAVAACMEGIQFLTEQKYPEALTAFDRGGGDPLLEGSVDELRGVTLFIAGRFKEAVEPYGRVAARGRQRAYYLEGMTWMAIATMGSPVDAVGSYERAVEAITKGIAIDPEPSGGYSHRAVAYQRHSHALGAVGQPAIPSMDACIADCEEALKRNPNLTDPYETHANGVMNRAELEEGAGRDPTDLFEKAARSYTALMNRNLNKPNLLYIRGNVYNRKAGWLQAHNREAMEEFNRAMADYDAQNKAAPLAEAWSNRGNVLQSIAHIEDVAKKDSVPTILRAIDSYVEALKLNPKLPEALNNRGNARIQLADLETAFGRDPKPFQDLAMEDYLRATVAKPEYFNSWVNIGNLAMKMGDVKVGKRLDASKEYLISLDAFDQGYKLRPDVWNFVVVRAYLFIRLGRPKEATACFEAGFQAFASNPTVLAQLKTEREKLLK